MLLARLQSPEALILRNSISMSIYSSEKVLPYVYKCVHRISGLTYIGSRTTKRLKYPSHIDFPKYKTSSNEVHSNFGDYDWIIIAEFFDPKDAYDYEQELIFEFWKKSKELSLNRSCFHGKLRFMKTSLSEETKRKIGLKSKGRKLSQESRDKISRAKLGSKYSEQARRNISEGHKGILHTDEAKLKMSKSRKGKPISEDHKKAVSKGVKKQVNNKFRRKQDIVTCPHCNKSGGELTMPRWHFKNCKLNPDNI